MSLTHSHIRKGLFAALLFVTPVCLIAQTEDLTAPDTPGTDMVDRIVFRDDTTDQILNLMERLTGRSVIRPQALPAATFTFNSQRPMTRDEAILALQSLLTINGIGVSPMGDLFLKVVPLARVRSEAPEFLSQSTLELPASGRIVSRMIELEFLAIDEVQAQLNLMITAGSGSIIPFPKANAMMITDTVSNLQSIEQLLNAVDRPALPRIETNFYPVRYARASDLVNQIQAFAGSNGFPELSGRTTITADERSNQIILIADRRQVPYFENLIDKLDVQAELVTRNEVIFLNHAQAPQVAALLSQLAVGRGGAAGVRTGTGAGGTGGAGGGAAGRLTQPGQQLGGQTGQRFQTGTGRQQTGTGQRTQPGTGQRQTPQVPQIPGQTRSQSAEIFALQEDGGGAPPPPTGNGTSIGAAEGALTEIAGTVSGSDFSESLTILADERSNAIVVSGTRQDIELISDLIEKIDIILAQVRIEVFIAEVTLSETSGRGIESFGISYTEGGRPNFDVSGPGYNIVRDGLDWEALFTAAETRADIAVLSNPTIMTTHNQEATLSVAEARPVITGTTTGGQFQAGVTSAVTYREIGIQLVVLPLIGADGTIQLVISQTADDLIGEVMIDGNQQPIIGTRSTTSFVSVANRETVILGGLQSTRKSDTYGRLGIIGQIPLLGNLFTYRRQSPSRTELIVFIRPTVLPTTTAAHEDAQELISRHSREPSIRHQMEPEVYPDPEPVDQTSGRVSWSTLR